ncbi:metallopeptidase family protein [Aurantiacibacter xanthus]|uniref:Metallopeptidase family protein n=1 Tax=Aurantiacibacter xanthus TaxID=1784712 RepID=A0A3A1P6V1_9SPHN|nr:metallopeptidase family protein [Aurantiacibacter xanthus]RIV84444.1 metallopeptidase family protein [Aurantiacibacter xanthus]
MIRTFAKAPDAQEIEAIARQTLARLPAAFAEQLGNLNLAIEDFAEDALLDDLGIESAYELTGVYEGIPLTEQSIDHSGTMPERVRLFRLPILLEWCERGDVTLEDLVAHVVIHEIGHHFGLSDADMHTLEDQVL